MLTVLAVSKRFRSGLPAHSISEYMRSLAGQDPKQDVFHDWDGRRPWTLAGYTGASELSETVGLRRAGYSILAACGDMSAEKRCSLPFPALMLTAMWSWLR